MRAAVVRNSLSHRNRGSRLAQDAAPADVLEAAPESPQALEEVLADFAAREVDLLVVDGGDGTVREVLSRLPEAFRDRPPRLAVLPSGKTNVLAMDLGAPRGWTLEAALARARSADRRLKTRACLEVVRAGADRPERRGFIFGAGAFVRATRLAASTHSLGFFGNGAVAATLAAAAIRCLLGGPDDPWRAGEPMRVGLDDGPSETRDRFLVLASTLKRLPMGLRPFGPPREGLKVLSVEAPPRRLHAALAPLLRGRDAPWLEEAGYVRREGRQVRFASSGSYVLDGEVYPAGDLVLRKGPAMEFVA